MDKMGHKGADNLVFTCSKAECDYDPLYEDIFQISQAEHIGYYKAYQCNNTKEGHQFQEPHRSEPSWKIMKTS